MLNCIPSALVRLLVQRNNLLRVKIVHTNYLEWANPETVAVIVDGKLLRSVGYFIDLSHGHSVILVFV